MACTVSWPGRRAWGWRKVLTVPSVMALVGASQCAGERTAVFCHGAATKSRRAGCGWPDWGSVRAGVGGEAIPSAVSHTPPGSLR